FNIAVDEMRHLRWVNEALDLLGEPPSLGRAERIGRQLDRPFSLEPLTPAQLQWFIDVERPSQELTGTLDGMYVRLHISIDRQPGLFAERERLVHLIKLIIDEGEDHFVRFSSVQRHLNGLSPTVYLRPLRDPSDPSTGALADLADQNYAVVLGTLQMSFLLGDRAGGILLEQARQAMFRLHETSHFLAARNVAPRFLLPPAPPAPPPSLLAAPGAHALVGSLQSSTHAAVSNVAEEVPEPAGRALAQRQLAAHDEMFDLMHRLIDEDLGG
ncbi:MAG: ferritin-like domain-containing protein, partial [Actinomycetota bacterium]